MIACETTTRKWGSSLGITLPKEIVDEYQLKENESIRILILKQDDTLRKTFGILSGKFKKSTQQMMDDARKQLYRSKVFLL